jgi:hypothetical protein
MADSEGGHRALSALGLAALGAVVALIAWLTLRSRPSTTAANTESEPAGKRTVESVPVADTPSPETTPTAKQAASTGPALDRAKRDQLRTLIWKAIGQPSPPERAPTKKGVAYVLPERPPWSTPPPGGGGDAAPGIEPKYIRERVRNDFFPLARKCYGDALETNPSLGGKVVLAFNIVGDAKTGGIVEAVDVLNESTLRDPDVIDCMRQSFLSVTFPPPANGGEVTVTYPIIFSNDDGG